MRSRTTRAISSSSSLPGWRISSARRSMALWRSLGVTVVELVDGALIELESVIRCGQDEQVPALLKQRRAL